jgi:hypothetical protein
LFKLRAVARWATDFGHRGVAEQTKSRKRFKHALFGLIAIPVLLGGALLYHALFESQPERRGNTVGNIVNGGLVAQEGNWIYYSNGDSDFWVYKMRTDGSGRQRVE